MLGRVRLLSVLMLAALCVCFLSVPVFSDDGDEDPWDADNSGPGDGTFIDTSDGGGGLLMTDAIDGAQDPGSDWLLDLLTSLPYQFSTYFYGDLYGTSTGISIRSKGRGVTAVSEPGNQLR